MIKKVRDTEKMLGKVDYEMTKKKQNSRRFSRSLYISKNIKAGEVITEDNVRSVRPGHGLHPKYFKKVLGKKIKKNGSQFIEFYGSSSDTAITKHYGGLSDYRSSEGKKSPIKIPWQN